MPGLKELPAVLFAAATAGGVAAAAALLLAAPAAGAPKCPDEQILPRVSLQTNSGRIIYNSRKSRRQLKALQGRRGGSTRNGVWHPIGLTLTELQFRMKISINTLPRPGRGHCATVTAVEAELGYGEMTVYVDRRYRKGSCQYLSVLEHENEHVAIFRDTLASYTPKVERRLNRAASKLKPISATTPGKAAARLQKKLQQEMKPLFKEINAVLDRKNDSIDTARNYKREQARCSQW